MTGFNPQVFQWARESAGLGLEDAARAIHIVPSTLSAIEEGEKEPSRTNLSNMAKVYRRSLITLYLATPPKKGDRGEDFRTVVAERTIAAEADVDAMLRDLRARQSLVRSVLEDEDEMQPLAFINSAKMQDGAAALCRSIEQTLGITRQQYRAQRDAEQAFNLLREKAEKAGVFVLLVGNLGSHHSTISVETFRGFAIADPIAPFVVINDGDAKAAWSFTLIHELAHLWLGSTGVSGGRPDLQIERFCNEVTSEFLLPRADLAALNIAGLETNAQITVITEHATRWRVSRPMVAYGLYKAGRITLDTWRALDTSLRVIWAAERRREKELAKAKKGAPSFYVVKRHRLGHALLDFAHHSMDAGTLSAAKAAKVLGVKPRSVYPLLSIAA